MKILTYSLSVAILFSCVFGASIQRDGYRRREEQIGYLERFGYLGGRGMPAMTSGRLTSSDSANLERALRSFQRMARIPVTGVMDQATIRMMNVPRCGLSDNVEDEESGRRAKRFAIAGSRWSTNALTYRIHNTSPDLSVNTQENVIDNAFKMWANVSPLRFTRRRFRFPKSDINIEFARADHGDGSQNRFDGPEGTLAHATFPPHGAIHFDEDEEWISGGGRGKDLLQVAVHEIGHALGLQHSQVYESIMYPLYKGDMTHVQLHSDDIRGIQRIYGSPRRG